MPLVRFGSYEVLARLASGGAGHVFLARREKSPRLFCLKTLSRERLHDPAYVAAFGEEAALSERLSHPACVRALDSGYRGQVAFLCLEYVVGETLASIMRKSRETKHKLAPEFIAAVGIQLLGGLHHAHELTDEAGHPLGVIHRDISPQNAMIGYDGQSRILDLGVAKTSRGEDTQTGIVKGKAAYMSPEQITGRRIDRRSDLYSLAIVLFEALTSQRLHEGGDAQKIAEAMHYNKPPRLSDYLDGAPLEWESIILRALALDPERRYPTADAMQHDLQSYLRIDGQNELRRLIAEHMGVQFGSVMKERQDLLRELEMGTYDEDRVLEILDAHIVRRIDLIGDDPQLTVRAYDDPMVVDFMGQRAVVPTAEFAEADPTVSSMGPTLGLKEEPSDDLAAKVTMGGSLSGETMADTSTDDFDAEGFDDTVMDPEALRRSMETNPTLPPKGPGARPKALRQQNLRDKPVNPTVELPSPLSQPATVTPAKELPSWGRPVIVLVFGLGLGLLIGLLSLQ